MEEMLSDEQWQIVHGIASTMAKEQIQIDKEIGKESDGLETELKKVVTYLYAILQKAEQTASWELEISKTKSKEPNVGAQFFTYLEQLVKYGKDIGHSKTTSKYYRHINTICIKYLKKYQRSPSVILRILGWVARLIRYYKMNPDRAFTALLSSFDEKKNRAGENVNPLAVARAPKPPKQ